MKFTFSGSHLAPKVFKVVANSKKLVATFKEKINNFFLRCQRSDRPSKMKLAKRSFD